MEPLAPRPDEGGTAPGFPATVLVESSLYEAGPVILIIHLLKLGWKDISDRFQ